MGILGKTATALQAVSGELTALRAQQDAARERLLEIDGQVRALRAAPLSLEDFQGYIDHFVAMRGSAYGKAIRMRDWVKPNRGSGYDMHVPFYLRPWSEFEGEDGTPNYAAITLPDHSSLWDGRDAFGAWCFFAPELVTQKLGALLVQEAGTKWVPTDAPPVAQRRTLIDQLTQERDGVEDELQGVAQSIAEISKALGV